MKSGFSFGLALAVAAALGVTVPAGAKAQTAFGGKTIKITVGFGPGGGYDAYGRLLGRHIGGHIPGKPRVVVQNMPGAGSLKAVQYLKTSAPRDGTAIVTFNFGQITRSLVMPPKKFKVDFRDFAWLGSIDRDVSVCYVWKSRFSIETLADLPTAGNLNFGLTAPGSASYFNQSMLKGVFGAKIKQVKGYRGSKAKQIAIERGELDGDCGAWSSVPQDWLRDGKVTVLLRYSPVKPESMPASIPYAVDVAPNEDTKKIIRLLTQAAEVGRPFITHKDAPADRLAILRQAFDATMKDPAFLADAKKQRRDVSPMTAKEAVAAIESVYALPADIVAKAGKILIK